jgi:hypothetical protein
MPYHVSEDRATSCPLYSVGKKCMNQFELHCLMTEYCQRSSVTTTAIPSIF